VSDITDRLRAWKDERGYPTAGEMLDEAAAEIERLVAEVERHRMTEEERAYADRVVGYMHAFGPSDARELEGYLKRTAPEAK